jgi:hypothetical protein
LSSIDESVDAIMLNEVVVDNDLTSGRKKQSPPHFVGVLQEEIGKIQQT